MDQKPLTVKELSGLLGVHTDTIYKMARKREIPHFRIGGKILFSSHKVEAWIHDQETSITTSYTTNQIQEGR